ncbi:MAG: hypothetical protein ACRDUV_21800 [Pseudonocardiaceae bacterium]
MSGCTGTAGGGVGTGSVELIGGASGAGVEVGTRRCTAGGRGHHHGCAGAGSSSRGEAAASPSLTPAGASGVT